MPGPDAKDRPATAELPAAATAATLDELEDNIRVAHTAILRSYECGLQYAMEAGDAIIAIHARKLIRHGQGAEFYRRTCGSVRTGQVYVHAPRRAQCSRQMRRALRL